MLFGASLLILAVLCIAGMVRDVYCHIEALNA